MSKGGGKTVKTVQDTSPWKNQQPYLDRLFQRADSLYGQGTGVSPRTTNIQDLIYNRALTGSPLVDAASRETQKTIEGGYSNPYAKEALGDTLDMARSRINAQFTGDNSGSSAHKEWLSRGLTAAALPFASQLYENERGRQSSASALAPVLASQDFTNLGQGLNVSRMADNSPWEALQRYQGAVGGNYGGTSTGTEPYSKPNNFLNAAALAAMYFSDRRLKRDIEKVGMHPVGVPLYSFRYLNDDTPRIGVMADEVEQVMPEAVGERDGYLTVNYAMLGGAHG